MKTKILYIENSVSHIAPGGSHKSLLTLCKNIDGSKFEPFILLNQRGELHSRLFNGVDVIYLDHQTVDIKPDSKIGFYKKKIIKK